MVNAAFLAAQTLFRQHGFEVDERYTPSLVEEIDALLKRGKTKGDKVAVLFQIKTSMISGRVAVYKHVAPARAGVSSKNRSRLGVVGSDSQVLGETILRHGWNDHRTEESSSFDLPPPPLDKEERDFNKMLFDLGDGLIPLLEDLEVITVGGSHTNTFLRQVIGEVRAVVAELSDTGETGGKLNYEQLVCDRPAFKCALGTGLKYWCGHWQSVYIWPDLPDFLQDSLNIVAKLIVSEPEIMLKISDMAANAKKNGEPATWKLWEKAAANSNPACVMWIDKLSAYVQLHGGDGELIAELAEYAKSLETQGPKRLLGAEFFSKINNLKFGRGVCFPRVVNATLELQLAGPKVTNGNICNFLTPGAMSELVKESNRGAVQKAEELMSEARKLVTSLGLQRSKVVKSIGRLDVRTAAVLTKTSKALEGKAVTMAEVAEQFLAELSGLHGTAISWNLVRAGGHQPAAANVQPDVATDSLDSVDQMLDPVYQAQKLGYVVGAFITCKDDSTPKIYKLQSYSGMRVKLSLQESGHDVQFLEVEVQELLKQFRIHKGSVTTLLQGWSAANDCSPLALKTFKFDLAKSKVMLALANVFEMLSGNHCAIELLTKPFSARATMEVAVGDFAIAPCSTKLERKHNDGAWFLGAFDLGDDVATPLFMSSMFVPPVNNSGLVSKTPWVVPFFFVATTKDRAIANCEIRFVVMDGVKVPVLTNHRSLHPRDELMFHIDNIKDFASSKKKYTQKEPAPPATKKTKTR